MTSFADLQTGPITGDEGRALVRALVTTAPYPIPAAALDTPGAPEGAIVWALGEAEAQRSAERAFFAKSATRSTATRPYLGVAAREQYSLIPRDATFATTDETVTNTSGLSYGPFPAGALRFKDTSTKKIFTNVAEVAEIPSATASPFTPGTVTVSIRALEQGSVSNALPGAIDALETPLEGVSCTNAVAAYAQDAEDAASLNARIDAKIGSIGEPGARGWSTGATSSALEAIAMNGPDDGGGCLRPDGSRIIVTRTRTVRDDATGIVYIYLADDDGPLDSADLLIVQDVLFAYGEWVCLSVDPANAGTVAITVSANLTISGAAATDAAIRAQIAAELVQAQRRVPVGGWPGVASVPLRYVENAVESACDAGKPTAATVVDITMVSPSAGTALSPNEIPVFTVGTINITRVA